jgi:hypothetical protein
MPTLPWELAALLNTFASLFSKHVWEHVQVLVVGAILAPGKRTVTSMLRVMALGHANSFQNDHRVLNRAAWSSLKGSRLLLLLLVQTLAPAGPLVLGLDDTLERRWGAKIQAKGIYRDPVRSSHSHMVKASGLRWWSLMLVVPIPWIGRLWALPFLTGLAPAERYHQDRGQRHKQLPDWAQPMRLVARRWVPKRALVVVTDRRVAVMTLRWRMRQLRHPIGWSTRLRLDAARYEPAPPRTPRQNGRPRVKGQRLPTLAQVLASTATLWVMATVRGWYGDRQRVGPFASAPAVW